LSWTSRFAAPTCSVAATFALCAFLRAIPAAADAPLDAVYQKQTIRFTHVASVQGAVAIGVEDPGFQMLLRESGAILTWTSGERYVLLTTAVPEVVSFSIGDRRYDVGQIALEAAFAPYERADEAFLPFNEVLGALDLALRQDGRTAVLQPQLAGLDVRQDGGQVTLLAHAGVPVTARIERETPQSVQYAFDGVATQLAGTRQIGVQGVQSLQIAQTGSVRAPVTHVTVNLVPGTAAQPPRANGRDVTLAFAAPAAAPGTALAAASPTPVPASNGPALVTGASVQASQDGGLIVAVAVNGSAAYEWHRLRDPDNRFWLDVHNATLQGSPTDQTEQAPLLSMRIRQIDPQTVRVALSLDGPKGIALTPSSTGIGIAIGSQDVADQPHTGSGTLGALASTSDDTPSGATPAPLDGDWSGGSNGGAWKFGPHSTYVPTNPRLIVIDPGHGGSDRGTIHGGVDEADLTLDMSKRLRDILVSRGWQVRLTHDTDVDVYAPDDSAHQELQARVDVANNAGARLFVSLHVNAFINAGPYGTTLYVSKAEDVALARQVENKTAADGTKDDGIVKSHLYVTLHSRMPAVLVETAFLSNPSDYALLTSPAWRQKVAEEIADGIGSYTQQYPVPNQPAQ